MDSDFMEFGQGLISLENGWTLEKKTGNRIDPNGNVFSNSGELLWSHDLVDPDQEEYDR